jgi:O-antigen ligase
MLAVEQGQALRNTIFQLLVMVNAYLVLTLPRNERDFANLFGWTTLGAVALSYAGVIALPQIAIHQAGDIAEPMLAGLWRGHFLHKNYTSSAMVVAVFAALYMYSQGWRWRAYLLGVAAAFFLLNTGGKTALASLPAIIMLCWAIERFPAIRWPIVIIGLVAFNGVVIGVTLSADFAEFIASLGIDATFTNRVDIWHIALGKMAEASFAGLGLNTFWGSYGNLYGGWEIESWAYGAGSAHNGYIDLLLNIGLGGTIVFVGAFIILPLIDIKPAFRNQNNPDLTRFFLRLWLFGLINACMESVFFSRTGVMWFAFLVACCGLHFQARAALVKAGERKARQTAMALSNV